MDLHRETGLKLATLAVLALAPATAAMGQLEAFPGAEGAGAYAVGGRGGDVYHVTKLTDYTGSPSLAERQGTLRHAIASATGPRTIVFDVGGTIQLKGNLSIDRSNITLAGQTAPGQGITLRDYTFAVTSPAGATVSDVIVRHLRSRKGNATDAGDAAGVLGSGLTRRVIFDHVSASWGEDEVLSVTHRATDVTVQYSSISEGLNAEGHGYGSLVRPEISSTVTFHHNLYAHNHSRNPRPGTYNGQTLSFDFRNNVVYNWGDQAGYSGGAGEFVNMNFVGNYLVAGPSTQSGEQGNAFDGGSADTVIYQVGNRIDPDRDAVRDGADTGWAMFGGTFAQRATPFAFAAMPTEPADAAYASVMAGAGALPWSRDIVDQRIFASVANGTGSVIDAPNAAEWAAIVNAATFARPAGWDTDGDGMPNFWESLRGLDPGAPDNNLLMPDGYTALEHYLHAAATGVVPEPGGLALLGAAGASLVARRRRA